MNTIRFRLLVPALAMPGAALQRALLSDREAQVRQAAAELFGRLRDIKTLPALRQAYREDSSRQVRQAAYRAIVMREGYQGV